MRAIKRALLLLTALGGSMICCLAQTPPPATTGARATQTPPPSSNRYLLVVDTSRSMRDRTNAIGQVIQTVLLSGMDGQMRPGDTLGLWTYNERLSSGQFPLQLWVPQHRRQITMQAFQFVAGQRYERKSNLATVLPDLLQLIKHSDFITVILVTDGNEQIHGTPFDDKINESFRAWKDRQERLKMPIVVFLRGQKRQITDYRVSTPPWPLDPLPPPPPLKPALVNQASAPPAAAPKAESPRVLPPLIVHGPQAVSTEAKTTEAPEKTSAPPVSIGVNEPLKVNAAAPPADHVTHKPRAAAPSAKPQAATGSTAPPAKELPKPAPQKPVVSKTVSTNAGIAPVQGVISPAAKPFFDRKKMWIAGLVLLAIILGLLWRLARGSRGDERISLITRSLESDDNQSRS